jgi:hypothetical protein
MHDDQAGTPEVMGYDGAMERAVATVLRRRRGLARERSRAAAALAPVLAGERRWRELAPAEARAARTPALVELLLERARTLAHEDPAGMLELAHLALGLAERLRPGRRDCGLLADLRARCWCELANACRVGDELAAAWRALGEAVAWAARGSGDLLLAGRIVELGASLLGDQRRFAAADELLVGLEAFYRGLGECHLAARSALKRGHFASCAGDPQAALVLTAGALADLDPARDPELPPLALKNLIEHAAAAGRFRKARLMLWRARTAGRLPAGRASQLRLLWIEGRIAAGLGRPARAEAALRAAQQGFVRAGSLYSAALVALDLGALLVEQGRRGEVEPLLADTLRAFDALRIAREASLALLLLRSACERATIDDHALCEHIRLASLLLRRLEGAAPAVRSRRSPPGGPAAGARGRG